MTDDLVRSFVLTTTELALDPAKAFFFSFLTFFPRVTFLTLEPVKAFASTQVTLSVLLLNLMEAGTDTDFVFFDFTSVTVSDLDDSTLYVQPLTLRMSPVTKVFGRAACFFCVSNEAPVNSALYSARPSLFALGFFMTSAYQACRARFVILCPSVIRSSLIMSRISDVSGPCRDPVCFLFSDASEI